MFFYESKNKLSKVRLNTAEKYRKFCIIFSVIICLSLVLVNSLNMQFSVNAKAKPKLNKTSVVLYVNCTMKLKLNGQLSKKELKKLNKKIEKENRKIIKKINKQTVKRNKEVSDIINGKTTASESSPATDLSSKLKEKVSGKLEWSSENPEIASVSSKGVITAKKNGTTKIVVKYMDKTYKCKVTVKTLAKPKPVLENTKSGVKLTWDSVPDAKGYYVYRSTDGKDFKRLAIVKKLYYVDKDVVNSTGTRYYYGVRAYKSKSQSDLAKDKIYRVGTPEIMDMHVEDYNKLIVDFKVINGVTSYELKYVSGNVTTSVLLGKNSTRYIVNNIDAGADYKFSIRGKFKGTYSEWSGEKTYSVSSDMLNFSLNECSYGTDDICWSWWTAPQAVTYNKIRNNTYFGYTTNLGYIGVGAYDMKTGTVVKTNLAKTIKDDHNACSVNVLSNGKIMAVYSSGHNVDNKIHIRISSQSESITKFDRDKTLEASGKTCYAQVYKIGKYYYIFYRSGSCKWCFFKSSNLKDWSKEQSFVTSNFQYYIKLTKTTDPNIMRVNMMNNPTIEDCSVRQGFINFAEGKVYSSDMSYIGKLGDPIDCEKFDVVIQKENRRYIRLFDVAITDVNSTEIAYCTWKKNADVASYYILRDGVTHRVIKSSESFWDKYFGGMSFINKDSVVVSYGKSGKDSIVVLDYKKQVVEPTTDGAEPEETYKFEVTRKISTTYYDDNEYRSVRPIVDQNKKCILWLYGYYDSSDYTSFNMDARFEPITWD